MSEQVGSEYIEQAIKDVAEYVVEDPHLLRKRFDAHANGETTFQIDATAHYAIWQRATVLQLQSSRLAKTVHSLLCKCGHYEQYHTSGVIPNTVRGCLNCDCSGFEPAAPEAGNDQEVPQRRLDDDGPFGKYRDYAEPHPVSAEPEKQEKRPEIEAGWCASCDVMAEANRPKCPECGDWLIFGSDQAETQRLREQLEGCRIAAMDYQKWIDYGKTIASGYGDGEAKQVAVTRHDLDAAMETVARLTRELAGLRESHEELARLLKYARQTLFCVATVNFYAAIDDALANATKLTEPEEGK